MTWPLTHVKPGDEVEIHLIGVVKEIAGGCARIEIFLDRPSKQNVYATSVRLDDLYPVSDKSIRPRKVVVVPKPEA